MSANTLWISVSRSSSLPVNCEFADGFSQSAFLEKVQNSLNGLNSMPAHDSKNLNEQKAAIKTRNVANGFNRGLCELSSEPWSQPIGLLMLSAQKPIVFK